MQTKRYQVTQLYSCTSVSKRRKKGKVPGTSKHGSLACSQSAESDWTHTRNDSSHQFCRAFVEIAIEIRGDTLWTVGISLIGSSCGGRWRLSVTRIVLDREMEFFD